MRARPWMILAALTAGITLPAAPLLAVPVSCLGSSCTVSDGPASVTFDGTVITSLTVNGIEQLSQQGLLVTLGVNSAGNPLTSTYLEMDFPLVSATQDEDTNQIALLFDDGVLTFTVTYTLAGAPLTATLSYLVVVQNAGFITQEFALGDFIDFDLMSDSDGDTVTFTGPNFFTQTGKGATATARSISAFNFHDVGECCLDSTLNRLVNGHLSDDNGPAGPGDVSGAFQDNVQLPVQDAFTISRQLQVTIPAASVIAPAPALSALALAGALLALAGIAGVALRRRGA